MLHAPKSHGAFLIHMKEVYNTCISKSVHVYRDYTLEVEFNVSFDEFRKLSADTKNLGSERAEAYARAE